MSMMKWMKKETGEKVRNIDQLSNDLWKQVNKVVTSVDDQAKDKTKSVGKYGMLSTLAMIRWFPHKADFFKNSYLDIYGKDFEPSVDKLNKYSHLSSVYISQIAEMYSSMHEEGELPRLSQGTAVDDIYSLIGILDIETLKSSQKELEKEFNMKQKKASFIVDEDVEDVVKNLLPSKMSKDESVLSVSKDKLEEEVLQDA